MTDNPLCETWDTAFGLPPFSRIAPEHFPAAFDQAIIAHKAELAAITASPDAPSFSNTVEAWERSGRLLNRVSAVFYNLNSSLTNDALDAVARDYAPILARHHTEIALDPGLFARVASLYNSRDELQLDPAALRLLERYYLGFVRAGALLPPDKKARIGQIAERLASLHTLFGQNVQHDEDDWALVLDEADLDGLPDFTRASAAAAAAERDQPGRFVITLSRSSIEPFLTFSGRRDLRRVAYEAWVARGGHPGAHDNSVLIPEILSLRAEQARLLGYDSYAAFKLDDTMAKTVSAAEHLLSQVWEPAKRCAIVERNALQDRARRDGLNDKIEKWDWFFYAEKIRQTTYDLDEAVVKPYFLLENIVQAAFDTAGKLFGLRFAPRDDVPAYHSDVRTYEVIDRSGTVTGLFLQDNFARPGKASGAWMSSFRDQDSLDAPVLPIIVNNNNFAKAEHTLLSFDDARTLFHEFGHGLHGLLSQVRYPSQSGTSVRHDFVEFPSQIFEHWVAAPELLRQHARHYQTGEPIPEALLARLTAAKNFNQGFATVSYTSSALADLAFHTMPVDKLDVAAFEQEFLDRIGMPDEIGLRHRPAHFQHLFAGSGYAAGYYAYLWAEVLDADGFAAFKESGNLFDPDLASRLKAIYSAGDTEDPMTLYRHFRGRDPEIEALLAQRGLLEKSDA